MKDTALGEGLVTNIAQASPLAEEQKKELQLYKNLDSYNFTAEFIL